MEEVTNVWAADFHDEETGETRRIYAKRPGTAAAVDGGIFMQWGPDGVFRIETLDQDAG